jgi:hypothetical protein
MGAARRLRTNALQRLGLSGAEREHGLKVAPRRLYVATAD